MVREFRLKSAELCRIIELKAAYSRLDYQIPCFFPVYQGKLPETGSLQTAPTTTPFYANRRPGYGLQEAPDFRAIWRLFLKNF